MPDASRKRTETQMATAGRKRARSAQRAKNREDWAASREERAREHARIKGEVMATAEIREAKHILNQVELMHDKVDTYFKLGVNMMAEEFGDLVKEELENARNNPDDRERAKSRRWLIEKMVAWKPDEETSESVEERARDAMAQAAAAVKVEVHDNRGTRDGSGITVSLDSMGRSLESPSQRAAP